MAGDGSARKSVELSYRLSIVSFALPHTTSIVSPKCPYVPLGVGGCPLGYEERRCCANCPFAHLNTLILNVKVDRGQKVFVYLHAL